MTKAIELSQLGSNLSVDSGNVGIGTNNPSGKLNIVGSDSQLLNIVQDSGDLAIRMNDRNVGSAYIKVPDNSSAALTFETGGDERIRIKSDGNVGIGTNNPADKFTVYGAPASVWNTSTNNRVWSAGTTNGHGLMKVFRKDGVVFARFDSDAKRAGLGTDSPSEQLHVYATSGSDVKIKIENTATDSYPTLRLTNDARTYDLQIDGATDSFRIWDSTASAQRFTIKSDGNVGIGTANPTQKLSVYGGMIRNDITAAGTSLILNGGGTNLQIRHTNGNTDFYNSGGAFSFSTATYSDALKLASNGAVMIGSRTSTNPQGNLTVARGEAIGGGTGPIINIVHGPDSGTQRTHSIYSYIGDLRIVADSNENMELHTGGNLSQIINSSGNVGIGTNAPGDRLTVYKSNVGNPTGITIRNTEASSTYSHARLRLESQNAAAYAEIWADVANSALRLGYNSSSTLNIKSTGNIGIATASPFSKLQVGSHTFTGGQGMYSNDRVGISNHGGLTGLMLASIYNDATHPEYGLVFVQGPNTSNYNVWSISPQGPLLGNKLEFIYQANATNIHTVDPKVVFSGDGNVGIGSSNPSHRLTVVNSFTTNDESSFQTTEKSGSNASGYSASGAHIRSASRTSSGNNHTAYINMSTRAPSLNGSHGASSYITLTSPLSQGTYGTGQFDFYIRNGVAYSFPNDPSVPSGYWMSSLFTIQSNGNIGIGSTTPSSKLYVNGTTRLGGGIDYGSTTILSVAPGVIKWDTSGVTGGRLNADQNGNWYLNNKSYPVYNSLGVNMNDIYGANSGANNVGGWVYLGSTQHSNPYPRKVYKIAAPDTSQGTFVYQVWFNGDANYDFGGLYEIRINNWNESSRFTSVAVTCINGASNGLRVYAYNTTDGIWITTNSIWGSLYIRKFGYDDSRRARGTTKCAVDNGGYLAHADVNGTSGTIPSGYTEVHANDSGGGGYDIENNHRFQAGQGGP